MAQAKEFPAPVTIDHACQRILASAKANGYAKAYARAGIGLRGEAAKVQALYILNNIQHWRGEDSKACRAVLKMVGGVK